MTADGQPVAELLLGDDGEAFSNPQGNTSSKALEHVLEGRFRRTESKTGGTHHQINPGIKSPML